MESPFGSESNPRFQKVDKTVLLGQCALFSGLSQWELKSIAQLMRLVEYKKNELIYKEGGEAGSFYVVVSGRFEAFITSFDKKKILAYLRRGDYFGEMSLLTSQPHSASVRALSDSLVFELSKDDFKKTIENNAKISLELSRRLSSRLKGNDPGARVLFKSDIISVFGNRAKLGRTSFSINLAASLFRETRQKTVLLDMSPSGSDISKKLHMATQVPMNQLAGIESASTNALAEHILKHPAGFEVLSVAHEENDSAAPEVIISILNHLAIDYRFIVIDLPLGMDETVFRSLTHSDHVFFMTDSTLNTVTETRDAIADLEKTLSFPEEKIAVVMHEVLFGIRTNGALRREFFGNKKCYSLATSEELKEFEDSGTPIVFSDPDAEYSRTVRHIARYVSNNLVGLVLGSGAALGLSHIGVLKVLEREKIPIDIIAGSSIGALIGSLYAAGMSAEDIEKEAMKINVRLLFTKLLDFNLFPFRGLMHGHELFRHFAKTLKNKTFDDCRIPLKVTGANLTTRQIVVFESGLLTEAVRTSIAIPALFKPVVTKGQTIVDGGILSPLPIRALHQAGANKIIAINVFPSSKDMQERRILLEDTAEREAAIMRKKGLLRRFFYAIGRLFGRAITPNIFDVLMNTIQSMESEIADVEAESADVLLRPVVANSSWIHFYKPGPFIKRGEEEAMALLPKIKALVAQQNV